jgi:tRNA threonylcarbamoyladenosine biosynthesis protein TsaE
VKPFVLTIATPQQLPEAAKQILQYGANAKVFAFYAEMGAGKTTLIKELCRQLGAQGNLSSPTYSIVNEYAAPNDKKIYHLDLYRLKNTEEAIAAGIEEYLHSGNYCFIEWPQHAEPVLPNNYIKIEIEINNQMREVSIFNQSTN